MTTSSSWKDLVTSEADQTEVVAGLLAFLGLMDGTEPGLPSGWLADLAEDVSPPPGFAGLPRSATDSPAFSSEPVALEQLLRRESVGHNAVVRPSMPRDLLRESAIMPTGLLGGLPNAFDWSRRSAECDASLNSPVRSENLARETEILIRRLGGFRNIGWTLNSRTNENGGTEYQSVVCSLRSLQKYTSAWMPDEMAALSTALGKCYVAESRDCFKLPLGEQQGGTPSTIPSARDSQASREGSFGDNTDDASSTNSELKPSDYFTPLSTELLGTTSNSTVLVWLNYVNPSIPSNRLLSILTSMLPSGSQLMGLLRPPNPSQGLLVFGNLLSAVDFIRWSKSKQLESFDTLVAGEQLSNSLAQSVLLHRQTRNAVGMGLVNISPRHPACIHSLLRLSQKDTVALGHKRTSTETLRLLLTHPEVCPVMVVPAAPSVSGRTSASHRRASIWCSLCNIESNEIPGAWKHLSRNPHETLRLARNKSLLEWVACKYPALHRTLMTDESAENPFDMAALSPFKVVEAGNAERSGISSEKNDDRKDDAGALSTGSKLVPGIIPTRTLNPEAPSFVPRSSAMQAARYQNTPKGRSEMRESIF